jgi:hypothetical protein
LAHDDAILAQLGVKAELARKMGVFGNFAISFSVICNLAGGMSLFGYGLDHGRPVVMPAIWIVIGFMTLLVGMSLADVVSAFPTSGGPYFMADKLGEPRWGWTTGWLNLLGLLGAIAGIDYGAAAFIGAFTQMQWGVMPTDTTTILTFGCILLLHGLLNECRVRLVTVLNSISVLHPAGRDAGRHPGIRCHPELGYRRATRPDLARCPGRRWCQGPAAHHHRGHAVLRQRRGRGREPDDLRVLPQPRPCRAGRPGGVSAVVPRRLPQLYGCRSVCRSSLRCPPYGLQPPMAPSPRSTRSA